MPGTRRLRRAGCDAGITLIEMLVALLIMAVVFAALAAFLITSIAAQNSNELRTQAVQLAQQSVEEGRALPWELTGFYADDAAASSCGTGDGPGVSLAVPASPAPKSTRVPTAGNKTVVVNGTTYTRTVCYRWIDDPGDNNGAGVDADGNTKDVKRIEVTLTWSVNGQARTYTATGLRAPTAAEVAPKVPGSASLFGILSVTPPPSTANSAGIDNDGLLTAPLTFTATTTTGVSIVQLRWTDANGTPKVRTLTSGASTTSWTTTLNAGDGPFAPLLTTFYFAANSPTGEVSNQTTAVAFSTTPGSLTIDELKATPPSVDVSYSGMSATAFTVTAKTNEAITSAVLRYPNRTGALVTILMAVSGQQASYTFPVSSGPFADAATAMTVSVNGSGGTATSSTNVTFVPPAIPKVEILSATTAPSLCVAINDGSVLRKTRFTVAVQGIGNAPDSVTLQLNDVAGSKVNASFIVQGANESTYAFDIPPAAASVRNWKNKNGLSITVLATRKSDNTQATSKFDSGIFEQNGGNSCPIT